jgi:RNA methyltransferase, TrmH family
MITSNKNPLVKNIKALRKSKERIEQNLFIVEGNKEIQKAITNGYHLETCLYCYDLVPSGYTDMLDQIDNKLEVADHIFLKIALRQEGIIALFKHKNQPDLPIFSSKVKKIVILDQIEKPGNIGGVLRTCAAAGVDLVLLSDPCTDIYNPNVIRASIGCVFQLPVYQASALAIISWLKENKIHITTAALTAKAKDFNKESTSESPQALVFGSENNGVSEKWKAASDTIVKIPMSPMVDSLNISVSAGILIYNYFL